jgi:hypothetical protein
VKLALFLLLLSATAPAAPETIDFGVDLDGTLVNKVHVRDLPHLGHNNVFDIDGVHYEVIHGALEFMAYLRSVNGAGVTFVSANFGERNKKVLEKLHLEGSRLLSRDSMEDIGTKDLLMIREGIDLDWTIMIENEKRYVKPGQEKSYLVVEDKYPSGWTMTPEAMTKASVTFIREWMNHSNRLVIAAGRIALALAAAEKEGITLVKALHRDHPVREYYVKGLEVLRVANPKFELVGDPQYFQLSSNPSCRVELSAPPNGLN